MDEDIILLTDSPPPEKKSRTSVFGPSTHQMDEIDSDIGQENDQENDLENDLENDQENDLENDQENDLENDTSDPNGLPKFDRESPPFFTFNETEPSSNLNLSEPMQRYNSPEPKSCTKSSEPKASFNSSEARPSFNSSKPGPSSRLDDVNLSNFNFAIPSLISVTKRLRQIQFDDFDPMTVDVDPWLNSFESKLIEFDALDQSLDVVIKFLDHFGLEFYRQTIR